MRLVRILTSSTDAGSRLEPSAHTLTLLPTEEGSDDEEEEEYDLYSPREAEEARAMKEQMDKRYAQRKEQDQIAMETAEGRDHRSLFRWVFTCCAELTPSCFPAKAQRCPSLSSGPKNSRRLSG